MIKKTPEIFGAMTIGGLVAGAAFRGGDRWRHQRLAHLRGAAVRAFDEPAARLGFKTLRTGKPAFELVALLADKGVLDHGMSFSPPAAGRAVPRAQGRRDRRSRPHGGRR